MTKVSLIEQMAFHRMDEPDVSLESADREYEIEIYAILRNPDEVIQKATSHEMQEQWGVFVPKTDKNAGSGTLRVRMTILPEQEPTYVFCTKTEGDEQGRAEVEDPVQAGQFQQLRIMADQGLRKTRYNVPHFLESTATNIVYQVDMFRNKKGELVPWTKIDAEVAPGTQISPEDIPFQYDELIIVTPEKKKMDEELRRKVGRLYAAYFRSDNELI